MIGGSHGAETEGRCGFFTNPDLPWRGAIGVVGALVVIGLGIQQLTGKWQTSDDEAGSNSVVIKEDAPPIFKFDLSWSFSYYGPQQWQHVAGGDNEMDIDPGDDVDVRLRTRIHSRPEGVFLDLNFTAREDGGDGTTLGGSKNGIRVYTAKPNETVVGVTCTGGCDRELSYTYRGHPATRHASFPVPTATGSYWTELRNCLDSMEKDDLLVFGLAGTMKIGIETESKGGG